jgi:glycosyltransferase involved in cell wall biosynthesis
MQRKVIIAEDLCEPIDEGIIKYSFHFAFFFNNSNNLIFSKCRNNKIPNILLTPRNKFLFNIHFYKKIKSSNPNSIIYIPFSSATLMSFIRLKLISIFSGIKDCKMISLQERKHGIFTKSLIKLIKPSEVIVLSIKEKDYFKNLGIKTKLTPIGVDTEKFNIVSNQTKIELRKKLNLPTDKKIILHVGHINNNRNILSLDVLQKFNYKIVIIGSTRFESDLKLMEKLTNLGFIIITDFIEDINEYYQTADLYAFPVMNTTSAMEFPLSILEAMSCNLPIITTPFGGINNFFSENRDIKFYYNEEELIEKVLLLSKNKTCDNRSLILNKFTWEKVFNNLKI